MVLCRLPPEIEAFDTTIKDQQGQSATESAICTFDRLTGIGAIHGIDNFYFFLVFFFAAFFFAAIDPP